MQRFQITKLVTTAIITLGFSAATQAAPIYAAQDYALSFEATMGTPTNVSGAGADLGGRSFTVAPSDIVNGLPWKSGDTFRATWNISAGSQVGDTATGGNCQFNGGPVPVGCRLSGTQSVSIIDPATNMTRITFTSWHFNDEGAVNPTGFFQGPEFTFSADGYVVGFRPNMLGSANPPLTYFRNEATGEITTTNVFSSAGASVAASNFLIGRFGILASGVFKDAATGGAYYDSIGRWGFDQGFSGDRWLLNGVSVPEPASILVFGLGIAGLAHRRRRHQR